MTGREVDSLGRWGATPSASRSASTNCPQDWNRSPGALAIALASTLSAAAGRSGRRAAATGAARQVGQHDLQRGSRSNGAAPVSIWKATQASAYWSARPSTAYVLDLLWRGESGVPSHARLGQPDR